METITKQELDRIVTNLLQFIGSENSTQEGKIDYVTRCLSCLKGCGYDLKHYWEGE